MAKRDTTKYSINNGNKLAKNRFVLEVVKLILKIKKLTFSELETLFPKEYQENGSGVFNTGVINSLEFVESKYSSVKDKRHFLKDDEVLTSSDGIKFVVSNQWNLNNVLNIVKLAENEGLEIKSHKNKTPARFF